MGRKPVENTAQYMIKHEANENYQQKEDKQAAHIDEHVKREAVKDEMIHYVTDIAEEDSQQDRN